MGEEDISTKAHHAIPSWFQVPFLGVALLAYFWVGYFGIAEITLRRQSFSLLLPADDCFPFVPAFGLVYMIGYFVVFVPPLVIRDMRMIRAGATACFLLFTAAYLCFILFPVRRVAPPVIGDSWVTTILHFPRMRTDHGMNCFPSLHVGVSCLCALSCLRVNRPVGLALHALTLFIALSTLLTRRHYLLDIPAGYLLGFAVHYGYMERRFRRFGWPKAKQNPRGVASRPNG
jgi:membrane-associated phospholipid phosphatase